MTDLVFATGNAHKVEEVQAILGEAYSIKSLNDIKIFEDIVEDGSSMEENALIKARYVYQKTGKPVFSEDSGLEVMALNMAPGLYTARYAGPQRNNSDNMDLLLKNMESVYERQARYRAVIAYIDSEGREYTFEGLVNGKDRSRKNGKWGLWI
jgi:XTP/dITP diphosphohydrolase